MIFPGRLVKLLALGAMLSIFTRAQDAGSLYKRECSVCHASEGTGRTAIGQGLRVKSFGSPEVRQNAFNWFGIIKDGKGKMPAYRQRFDTDRIVELLAYIRALPITASPGVSGYPMLDENHVYAHGEKIQIENPHGAYYGWIAMDGYYFLRPLHISQTERKQSSELIQSKGTVSASIRLAAAPRWQRATFRYTCEDLILSTGRVELAHGNENRLTIGSHNAICQLDETAPKPPGN